MKKWLLISSFIHVLILLIPFSFKIEKKEVLEKIKVRSILLEEKKEGMNSSVHPSKNKNTVTDKREINKKASVEVIQENIAEVKEENIGTFQEEIIDNISTENIEEKNEIREVSEEKIYLEENVKEENILNSLISEIKNEGNSNNSFIENETKVDNNNNFYQENLSEIYSNAKEIDDNIIENDIVKENKELAYKIISMPNPEYPHKAKNLNFNKKIIVVSEFLVGKDGRVKDIQLKAENDLYKKYSFDKSIEKAIKSYIFTPISYRGKIVEVKFIKNFEFN